MIWGFQSFLNHFLSLEALLHILSWIAHYCCFPREGMKFNKKVKAFAVQHYPSIKSKINKGVRNAANATAFSNEGWNDNNSGKGKSNINILGDALASKTGKKNRNTHRVKYPAASERTVGHEPVAKVAHYVAQADYRKDRKLVPPIQQLPRNTSANKRVF